MDLERDHVDPCCLEREPSLRCSVQKLFLGFLQDHRVVVQRLSLCAPKQTCQHVENACAEVEKGLTSGSRRMMTRPREKVMCNCH